MTTAIHVQGSTDSRFRAVEDAFLENFQKRGEVGASLAVVVDGKTVIDIWGGHADAARTRAWERDTLACAWSTTKGIVATAAHRLADQGLLDIDAPVAKYWPEFGHAGKSELPVRYLLNHQAGLPAIGDPLPPGAIFDWTAMTDALARQAPWWAPGTKQGYHAFTYGWLVGEVIRRVSGESVGTYIRDEIAGPLGAEFWIGLPEEHEGRVAEMIAPETPSNADNFVLQMLAEPTSLPFKVMTNPQELMLPGTQNSRAWRAAEIPGANGTANARGVARLYGALASGGELDGVRIMSPEAIARATVEQSSGVDSVLGIHTRVGLGYVLPHSEYPMGSSANAFGHSGSGGSIGFADPDARVGLGYVMNRMIQGDTLEDPRWRPLMDAVYASL